jgi:hypothetical protein
VGPQIINQPIRLEKKWFQGFSWVKFAVALVYLIVISSIARMAMMENAPIEFFWFLLVLSTPILLYILILILRTRPAAIEMDSNGVRLFRGSNLVKEVAFGQGVRVGVVRVGYWDDLSPGLFRVAGIDEDDMSLYDRKGFGPLFGYRFRGGGKRIKVSRRHGWDLAGIQWMWAPLMTEVDRHGMQMDRSMQKYLKKRQEMGLPTPVNPTS